MNVFHCFIVFRLHLFVFSGAPPVSIWFVLLLPFLFLVFLSVSLVSVGFPFLGPIFVDGPFFQLLGLFFSYCFCISVPNDFCIQNVFIS